MKSHLRLMVFVRRYWIQLLVGLICLLASTAFSLVIPQILSRAINDILSSPNSRLLMMAALYVVVAATLQGLFSYASSYLTEAVSQKVAFDIRNAIFDRLQRLSFAYYDNVQTGQLMSRATEDVEAVRRFTSAGILGLIQTAILLVAIAVILSFLNWQLALITLFFIVLIGVMAIVISQRWRKIWMSIQQLLGDLTAILEENLTGIRVVRAFFQQNRESQKFRTEATKLYQAELKIDRQIAFYIPLMVMLIGLPTAAIFWYGGRLVIAGTLNIGELTQFIYYLGILAMPVRRLGFISTMLSRSVSAGQRILEILEQDSPVKEKAGAIDLKEIQGEVRFERVSFNYDSTGNILKDVSFTVHPGQTVALVGGSGSGKSTIVSLIPRFYDPQKGRITVDGIDIREVTLNSLRKMVGIVQQDIFLFSTTIKENIAYGSENASLEDIIAAAKIAELHDFIQSLPDKYDTLVGERGVTLSGGERQRIAIARTILHNPRILIFDDSTSSVDAETELSIRRALKTITRNRTTFIITHRLSVIKNADIILVLQDGYLVEQGNHDELMKKNGLYRRLFESQLPPDLFFDFNGGEG